jgi:hypothetical protein
MGIIPDKFIMLDLEESASMDKIQRNLKSEDEIMPFKSEDIDKFAINAIAEYKK